MNDPSPRPSARQIVLRMALAAVLGVAVLYGLHVVWGDSFGVADVVFAVLAAVIGTSVAWPWWRKQR